ncbi:MAG: hypothetical protein Q8O56_05035 [Solirubrobacteraceae bacterium]|nr:hypothetical protein [Solirubrobacteraceae bacterium]
MRRVFTVTLALVASALGACGGGGERGADERSTDERSVQTAVEEGLASPSRTVCETRRTTAYLRQESGSETRAGALRVCRGERSYARARSVEVRRVAVRGTRATADVRTRGGELTFTEATIALRRVAGRWRLHALLDATLDRPRFFRYQGAYLQRPPDALDERETGCVLREYKAVSDDALVDDHVRGAFVRGLHIGIVCGMRVDMAKNGYDERAVRCATRAIRRVLRGEPGLASEIVEERPRAQRRLRAIATRCEG